MLAIEHFDLSLDDVEKLTLNAMKSAFIHYNERLHYIYNIIKPGFQKIRDKLLSFNNLSKQNEKTLSKL
jgi:adenosine deaminase